MMAGRSEPLLAPEEGRFQILGVIGRGANSVVYRAYDREVRTQVALKALEGWNPRELYRLKREFRILRSLRHPSLVEIFELFSHPSRGAFFSMELIEGRPLVADIGAEQTSEGRYAHVGLDPRSCAKLLVSVRELVEGLMLVHASGIVHRDVKPSNVLERSSGGVVLLDFGLAAHRDPEGIDVLAERGPAGTWVYMAPEAILGRQPTPACDWYSLAVLLFEAITGLPAFSGSAAEVWQAKQRGLLGVRGALTPFVSEPIADLIAASLDPDPMRRPDGVCWSRTLREQSSHVEAAPLPGFAAGAAPVSGSVFVGRERELDELTLLYRQAVRGQTTVAVVTGPGGIGKTELVRQFLRNLPLADAPLVLRARCHWQEFVPFNALDGMVDELGLWLGAGGTDLLARLSVVQRDALGRMFPALAPKEQEDEQLAEAMLAPGEVRRLAFDALRSLLLDIAEEHPLVLWIDDAQWADADSAALLSALFRPPEQPRALLILCQRSESGEDALPILGEGGARRLGEIVRIVSLGPLPREPARALVAAFCAENSLAPADQEKILQESEGSPLLLAQLARQVEALGGTTPASSPKLVSLVSSRAETLPLAARRILDVVALAVRPISRSLVLRIVGLGERGRHLVSLLDAALLLHSSRVGGQVLVEPYHQRIGEALRARLSGSEAERCHVLLAEHLAMEKVVEEERVFYHWRAAGRLAEAAEWAVRAADRAARQLAFEKAAELYAESLALGAGRDPVLRASVEHKRAEALVNAGRGAAAAPLFLALADEAGNSAEAPDLRRRAAEEYLMSGHVLEGTRILGTVLRQVGIGFPRSGGSALIRSAGRILPLWLSERRARAGRTQRPRTSAATRCDACHAAAKGLSFVDPPRGLYFSLHALRWALGSNDPGRVARALAFVGSNLLPMGGVFGRWAARMIDRAGALARMTDDPYLEATTALAMAQSRMMDCRWRDMALLCQQARTTLRTRCRAVAWEISVADMARLRALEEVGDLVELYRQAAAMVQEAVRTGNVYAEVTGLLYEGFCLLAAGDSAAARRAAEESARRWQTTDFHVQHFYAARLASLCDLYDGAADKAGARFEKTWHELQRSGLFRHTIFRLDALIFRARLLLAQPGFLDETAGRLRREVAATIRALDRERRADASGWALVFRASLASTTEATERSVELLTAAQQKFESAGMNLGAAVAGYRAAELWPGTRAEALAEQAGAVFAAAGVANPARFASVLAPGFGRGGPKT
ncbi:MAG: hypothetical protein KatS3mg077_1161 [Candidatus Binatia bacterium]|nr:MAG: hypothetical protein KatS3mg077_1161 [Candidatus Binatia bacterium]